MSRVVILGVDLGQADFDLSMHELEQLAQSSGAQVLDVLTCKRSKPDARFFIGSGKVTEIAQLIEQFHADLLIFSHPLAPTQQRNLEDALGVRVVDRTGLILDIFALRAQSYEGKLQVELVQLQHLSTRLIRGSLYTERQQGGIGLRGPGEKQLELDRRLIGEKIKQLKLRLLKLGKQRHTQRRQRERSGAFSVSLVGYTNAGKSTLFNTLTKDKVYVADQLFATLDTTSRRVFFAPGAQIVLSDTVGFISQLPHGLVAAFKATLEHTAHADLILHVVDASSAFCRIHLEEVNRVLAEIGAQDVPQCVVWNKIDETQREPEALKNDCGTIRSIAISARYGLGLDMLRATLSELASQHQQRLL